MRSPFWRSAAIIFFYDDSDGWYDHQMGPIVNSSAVAALNTSNSDQLNGPGVCGHGAPLGGIQWRCAYAQRQPFIVISPFARKNCVDHSLTDLSSVLRFIEDNWGTGRISNGSFDELAGSLLAMFDLDNRSHGDRRLILDEKTGEPR
jgi:phospholipase C